jgi:hypothetical protein
MSMKGRIQESEKSRIQNSESRIQKKRETEAVEAVSALSFWILGSEF